MEHYLSLVLAGVGAAITGAVVALSSFPPRATKGVLRRQIGAALVIAGIATAWAASRAAHATPQQTLVDLVMVGAYRPGKPLRSDLQSRYVLLAGDLHCHVSPPDGPQHAARGVADTLRLARAEGLDFVALTPHVWSHFFDDEALRSLVLGDARALADEVVAGAASEIMVSIGLEYTDLGGHVGMAFGDLAKALDEVRVDDAREHPEHVFQAYVRSGGVLLVEHPLATPLRLRVPVRDADLSWAPLTLGGPMPAELEYIDRAADGFEAYNLFVDRVRDGLFRAAPGATLREVMARLDQETLSRGQRMSPVGGSDSHGYFLRATTFVLAETRTLAGISDAIRAGRVCIRDAAACSFEARVEGGSWEPAGAAFEAAQRIEVRALAGDAEVVRNGAVVANVRAGDVAWIDTPACAVVRARVGEGYAAPVYVNCPFALRAAPSPR